MRNRSIIIGGCIMMLAALSCTAIDEQVIANDCNEVEFPVVTRANSESFQIAQDLLGVVSNKNSNQHPYLINWDGITIPSNGALKTIHDKIDSLCNAEYSSVPEYNANTVININKAREVSSRLLTWVYMYNYYSKTGNENNAGNLSNKIINLLKKCVDLENDWIQGDEQHFLNAAEMGFAIAIAYDALYSKLSAESYNVPQWLKAKPGLNANEVALSKLVRETLYYRVIEPSYNNKFHNIKGNWNQACHAGVNTAILATYHEFGNGSRHLSIADYFTGEKGLKENLSVLQEVLKDNGFYDEGYRYWDYGIGYETAMLLCIKEVSQTIFNSIMGFNPDGDTETIEDCLKNTAKYYTALEGFNGPFGYADGGCRTSKRLMAPFGLAFVLGARYIGDNVDILNEQIKKAVSTNPHYGFAHRYLLPLVPVMISRGSLTNLEIDNSNQINIEWKSRGEVGESINAYIIKRKENNQEQYLAVKMGKSTHLSNNQYLAGHAHLDEGSFVYDSKGYRWSEDVERLGDYSKYKISPYNLNLNIPNDRNKWNVLCFNNYGHSTITLSEDGYYQDYNYTSSDEPNPVKLREWPGVPGVRMDMTGAFPDDLVTKVHRTFLLSQNGDLQILDRIAAKRDVEVHWHMITKADVHFVSSNGTYYNMNPLCIELTQGAETLYLISGYYQDTNIGTMYGIEEDYSKANWKELNPVIDPEDESNYKYKIGNEYYYYKIVGWKATVSANSTVLFKTTLCNIPSINI